MGIRTQSCRISSVKSCSPAFKPPGIAQPRFVTLPGAGHNDLIRTVGLGLKANFRNSSPTVTRITVRFAKRRPCEIRKKRVKFLFTAAIRYCERLLTFFSRSEKRQWRSFRSEKRHKSDYGCWLAVSCVKFLQPFSEEADFGFCLARRIALMYDVRASSNRPERRQRSA